MLVENIVPIILTVGRKNNAIISYDQPKKLQKQLFMLAESTAQTILNIRTKYYFKHFLHWQRTQCKHIFKLVENIVPRIIDVGRKYSVNNSLCWQKEYLQWKQNSVQLFFDVGRSIVYTIFDITKYSTSNSLCQKITKCKQLILTVCKVETISTGQSSEKIATIVFILKTEFRERADDIFGLSRPENLSAMFDGNNDVIHEEHSGNLAP